MARPMAARPALPGSVTADPEGGRAAELAELAETRVQLHEARQTLEAIRGGDVDSLVIGPPGREQVYTLASADRPYRLIVEAMNEGAATISADGAILSANPRLAAMTGLSITDLLGRPVLGLIPHGRRPAFTRLIDVGAGAGARGTTDLSARDGRTVPVLLAVSGFDLDGLLLRCLVLTDRTAQHAAEEKAARAHDALRASEAEIRALNAGLEDRVTERTAALARSNTNLQAFTYSVSHDLRTPLRGLNGFSQALLEDYGDRLDEAGRGYARRIQEAADQMGRIIDDLLRLAEVSRADLSLEIVDLSAEVRALAGELQSREPGRRVRFVIEEGVRAITDRSLVRTLVRELMENAWKFTVRRAEAVIEFGTTPVDEAGICCYVRDNGVGFDPAYGHKLFQPFQRLHPGGEYPGTGIGLASVRRIAERLGRRASAEATIGSGATFYFTLDAAGPP